MSDHGMNCPHHADKDEACTCALTERTMHAAWRKRAEEAETRIAALEAQAKALTEERDQACRERADAQHRYTVAMHDISKACAGTTARSACEVVELWRKERDAQAEAVKSACRMAYRASYLGFDHAWGDSQISCIKNKIVRETMQDIARAAVEMGAEG